MFWLLLLSQMCRWKMEASLPEDISLGCHLTVCSDLAEIIGKQLLSNMSLNVSKIAITNSVLWIGLMGYEKWLIPKEPKQVRVLLKSARWHRMSGFQHPYYCYGQEQVCNVSINYLYFKNLILSITIQRSCTRGFLFVLY